MYFVFVNYISRLSLILNQIQNCRNRSNSLYDTRDVILIICLFILMLHSRRCFPLLCTNLSTLVQHFHYQLVSCRFAVNAS